MTSRKSFAYPVNLPNANIRNFIKNEEERVWQGPFTFIQAADTQLGMIGSYKLKQDEPCWEIEAELTKQVIKNVNSMNPKPIFLVICGDMLDAFPFDQPPMYYKSSKWRDKELRDMQYNSFIEIFQELDSDVKLICLCGNHDVGDHPTKESMEMYWNQFGSDYFSFWVGGVKFVVLNSQLMYSPDSLPDKVAAQNKFMDTIKDPQAKFIVVFQHIPYFIEDPYEDDLPTNIPKRVRFEVLDRLNEAGVKYVFCGHTHKDCGGTYKNLEVVGTSALGAPMGDTPSGYNIVSVNETSLSYEYVTLLNTVDFVEFKKARSKCSCCNKCTFVYNCVEQLQF